MKADTAEQMYLEFLEMLRDQYQPEKVLDGVFGAMMDVALVNDGPVTLIIESEPEVPIKTDDGDIEKET
jgi:D-tyrosyl-tRNA(Tyr) deacylase